MKTKFVILPALVAALLFSCDLHKKQEATLQLKVDSLTALVQNKLEMEAAFSEANALLDSIDASRQVLRNNMREGTTLEDFTSRIADLNSYVKRTATKIIDLEAALRSAKQSGSSYNSRVRDLKASLEKSNAEIIALQEQVNTYKNENDNLIKTVNLQQAEIEDKLNQISTKEAEVAQLEKRVNEILAQARQDEAEAYYARAEALELAANRTSFIAVKKKKTTRQQALDMYRMAVLYGKDDAQAKVDELAKKL